MPANLNYLCCGMIRSGSTWQYNVLCGLLERRGMARGDGFIGQAEGASVRLAGNSGRIFKVHEAFPACVEALRRGTAVGIYVHRDLRDVAASLMVRNRKDLDWVLAGGYLESALRNHTTWTGLPRVLVQEYAALIGEPRRCIGEMAAFVGIDAPGDEVQFLAHEFGIENQKQKVSRMKGSSPAGKAVRTLRRSVGNVLHRAIGKERTRRITPFFGRIGVEHVDRNSLLHSEHIHTGRIGSYREVMSPAEQDRIEEFLRTHG